MSSRHTILKRVAAWNAGVLLLLALYVASVPFVAFWSEAHAPRLRPFLRVLFAPVVVYVQHHNWPGSRAYMRYEAWCDKKLTSYYAKDPLTQKLDRDLCDIRFTETSLNQVAGFLSTLHECRVELDPSASPEVVITATAKTTLRDSLKLVLEPHGLAAAPIGERIVIGTPERIQQLTTGLRPGNAMRAWAAGLLSLLVFLSALLIFRRRRNALAQIRLPPDVPADSP
ncbi:MAG: hypothetical protein U0992_24410 [Planctomycetaceae bacterium]